MKKKIFLLLVLMLILSMVACGGSESEPAEDNSDGISVDENILTVDITLSASFFDSGWMEDFDPDAYVAENGFEKAVVNEDGSVTITMTKAKHKEVLEEMETSIQTAFDEMIADEDVPYIETIEPSKDYSTVTVSVDRAGYDAAWFDVTPLGIGFQVMFYQAFAGEPLNCDIVMQYSDNQEVISTTNYPSAFESDTE